MTQDRQFVELHHLHLARPHESLGLCCLTRRRPQHQRRHRYRPPPRRHHRRRTGLFNTAASTAAGAHTLSSRKQARRRAATRCCTATAADTQARMQRCTAFGLTLAACPSLQRPQEGPDPVTPRHLLGAVHRVQPEVGEHCVEVVGLERARQRPQCVLELGRRQLCAQWPRRTVRHASRPFIAVSAPKPHVRHSGTRNTGLITASHPEHSNT